MSWTDPSGHIWSAGETLSASNMNVYIEQNLVSLGAYAAATRYYVFYTAFNFSSLGALGGSTNIATFPEQYTMVVKVLGMCTSNAAATAQFAVFDEAATTNITLPQAAALNFSVNSDFQGVSLMGKKQYNAGATAGFALMGATNAGNVSPALGAEVTFVRGWV